MVYFNSLVHTGHYSVRMAKILILTLEGILKNFPITVATMSRLTKRSYLKAISRKTTEKRLHSVMG